MASVTSVGTFLDNLRTVLVARPGLAGVNIFTAGVDDISAGGEAIVFGVEPIDCEYDNPTMDGVQTWAEFEVEGRIWIVKPGAGETVIKTARDRALAVLEQVHDAVTAYDTTAAYVAELGVDKVRLSGWKLEQVIGDTYRDCRIGFRLAVREHFTPA